MEGRDRGSQEQVEFSHEGHTYKVDGRVIPSVSQILEDVGLVDTRWFKPEHANRGTIVHELLELIDKGLMDPQDVEEDFKGYVDAYLLFKEECKVEILEIEKIVTHKDFQYAGRVDRVCEIDGVPAVLDIKTGSKCRWHPVQLAAYRYTIPVLDTRPMYAIHLSNVGKYKLEKYWSTHYTNVWMAALTIYHYKKGG